MSLIRNPRVALGIVLLVLALAQLVPIDRSNPPVISDLPAPPEVKAILQRSCYACHSHETVWPFYGYVAPVSWLLAMDIHDAREEMNFSTWNTYRVDEREHHLEEIVEEIEEGHMPPGHYRLFHPGEQIKASELELLRAWVHGD
jgi:hypothetical protein